MRKFLIGILSVIVVDAFIFDFTLRIFPIANSKMILAVVGAIAYLLIGIRDKQPRMSLRVLVSAFLAVLFWQKAGHCGHKVLSLWMDT